jgi:uncharacterized protein involved in exopolysaccharide biosynthesis
MNSETQTEFTLKDLLHVIFKWRAHILGSVMAAALLGFCFSLITAPKYEAAAKILVKIGRENTYAPTLLTNDKMAPVVFPNREEHINSETEILKSQFLMAKVAESLSPEAIYPDLKVDADSWMGNLFGRLLNDDRDTINEAVLRMQSKAIIERVPNSNVIQITFRHSNPEIAAKVVNTWVDFYFDQHLKIHENQQSSEFYNKQSEILLNDLRAQEANLVEFKRQQKISSPAEERSILLSQIGELRRALNSTLSREAEVASRIQALRSQLTHTNKIIPLREDVYHNPPSMSGLQAQLVELEVKKQQLLSTHTDDSRLVRTLRDQIEFIRANLAEQEKKRNGQSQFGINPIYQDLLSEVSRSETELKGLSALKTTQMAHLASHKEMLEKLDQAEIDFVNLRQQAEVTRQNYYLFRTKFEESRLNDAMNLEKISNVSLIDHATPPLEPVTPKIALNVVLSILLGGIGGIGLAFFRERYDQALETEEDVQRYLDLPVLASIPDENR